MSAVMSACRPARERLSFRGAFEGQVEITASAASCSLTSNAIYTYFVTRSYP